MRVALLPASAAAAAPAVDPLIEGDPSKTQPLTPLDGCAVLKGGDGGGWGEEGRGLYYTSTTVRTYQYRASPVAYNLIVNKNFTEFYKTFFLLYQVLYQVLYHIRTNRASQAYLSASAPRRSYCCFQS